MRTPLVPQPPPPPTPLEALAVALLVVILAEKDPACTKEALLLMAPAPLLIIVVHGLILPVSKSPLTTMFALGTEGPPRVFPYVVSVSLPANAPGVPGPA